MRPTDEDLVARHLRGDPEAFAELVERYTGRLFHLTFRFTVDPNRGQPLSRLGTTPKAQPAALR
jgi:DNA-directed RNA polymerase specialized sigma24 family protein